MVSRAVGGTGSGVDGGRGVDSGGSKGGGGGDGSGNDRDNGKGGNRGSGISDALSRSPTPSNDRLNDRIFNLSSSSDISSNSNSNSGSNDRDSSSDSGSSTENKPRESNAVRRKRENSADTDSSDDTALQPGGPAQVARVETGVADVNNNKHNRNDEENGDGGCHSTDSNSPNGNGTNAGGAEHRKREYRTDTDSPNDTASQPGGPALGARANASVADVNDSTDNSSNGGNGNSSNHRDGDRTNRSRISTRRVGHRSRECSTDTDSPNDTALHPGGPVREARVEAGVADVNCSTDDRSGSSVNMNGGIRTSKRINRSSNRRTGGTHSIGRPTTRAKVGAEATDSESGSEFEVGHGTDSENTSGGSSEDEGWGGGRGRGVTNGGKGRAGNSRATTKGKGMLMAAADEPNDNGCRDQGSNGERSNGDASHASDDIVADNAAAGVDDSSDTDDNTSLRPASERAGTAVGQGRRATPTGLPEGVGGDALRPGTEYRQGGATSGGTTNVT